MVGVLHVVVVARINLVALMSEAEKSSNCSQVVRLLRGLPVR